MQQIEYKYYDKNINETTITILQKSEEVFTKRGYLFLMEKSKFTAVYRIRKSSWSLISWQREGS